MTGMGCFNDEALHSLLGIDPLLGGGPAPGALQVLYTLAVGCLSAEHAREHADFPFDYEDVGPAPAHDEL